MAKRLPRVLLIDDEVDIVSVLKQGLELSGFDVDGFTDPVAALEHFKPGFYDFVISDIRMPKVNGFQVYHETREKDKNVDFYFLTAFDIYEKEAKTLLPRLNAKRFIKKPIRYTDFAEILKQDYAQQLKIERLP